MRRLADWLVQAVLFAPLLAIGLGVTARDWWLARSASSRPPHVSSDP